MVLSRRLSSVVHCSPACGWSEEWAASPLGNAAHSLTRSGARLNPLRGSRHAFYELNVSAIILLVHLPFVLPVPDYVPCNHRIGLPSSVRSAGASSHLNRERLSCCLALRPAAKIGTQATIITADGVSAAVRVCRGVRGDGAVSGLSKDDVRVPLNGKLHRKQRQGSCDDDPK
jgi:hypothetical protein